MNNVGNVDKVVRLIVGAPVAQPGISRPANTLGAARTGANRHSPVQLLSHLSRTRREHLHERFNLNLEIAG